MADDPRPDPTALAGPGLGSWRIEPQGADYDGKLRIRLRRGDDEWVDIAVHPAGNEPRGPAQTDVGDLSYVGMRGVGETEAVRLTRSLGKHLARAPQAVLASFPHLASPRLLPAGDASPVTPTTAELLFDPPGLAELLEPELRVAGESLGPFTLRSIQLPMTSDGGSGRDCLLLELEHDDGERVFAEVGRRVTRRFAACGPLELGVRRFGRARSADNVVGAEAASLYSRLAVLLRNKLAATKLRFPAALSEMRALSVPAEGAASRHAGGDGTLQVLERPVLNLAVDAPCGQRCAFCSVLDYQTPSDGGDDELNSLDLELARARARGVQQLRLNGIDPLAFSRVLPLVERIADHGFTRMSVFTTGKRLADEAFARAFVDRAPAATLFYIPVYGSTAEIHDAVTGMPGAFELVLKAIDILRSLVKPPGELRLSSVVVRHNVDDLPALIAMAEGLSVPLGVHMPYPMRQTVRDAYADAVVRESDVVDRVLAVNASEAVRRCLANVVRHPCVLLAAEDAAGHELFTFIGDGDATHLVGTEYRSDGFVHVGSDRSTGDTAFTAATVPCPHAADCALAPACPKEQYAVYAQKFGWEEMQPVSPQQLYRLGR